MLSNHVTICNRLVLYHVRKLLQYLQTYFSLYGLEVGVEYMHWEVYIHELLLIHCHVLATNCIHCKAFSSIGTVYVHAREPQNEITVVKRDSIPPNCSPIHHNNALMCE